MVKNLKEKILNNKNFQIPEIYMEEDFTRELVSDNSFRFSNIDDIIIYISETENQDTESSQWYFTLDFGSFKQDYESQKEHLELISSDPNLISDLIQFIKQETNIDFSECNFGKPNIVLIEEGEIEIEIF